MRRTLPLVVLALGWVFLVPAAAARTVISPGDSAGNEYVETLPGASGTQALGPGASASLPGAIRQALLRDGTAGLLVLALGPHSPSLIASRRGGAVMSTRGPTSSQGPASRAESTGSAFTKLLAGSGPGGLGWAMPVILGGILLAALLAAFRRAGSKSARP